MQGEVYVTVEADASTPMLMAEGSTTGNGLGKIKYQVRWKTPGGISGVSWPRGMEGMNLEGLSSNDINSKVTEHFSGLEVAKLSVWAIVGCINQI